MVTCEHCGKVVVWSNALQVWYIKHAKWEPLALDTIDLGCSMSPTHNHAPFDPVDFGITDN